MGAHATRGRRRRVALAAAAAAALLAPGWGCNYSFRGGSFPEHIRTVAVVPFENETTRLELTQELHDVLLRNLPAALGVRSGGEDVADAVVRGTISGYDVTAPGYRASTGQAGAQVIQRQVVISIQVEIVDLVENVVLWEDRAVRAEGEYLVASETEETGKQIALDLLVQSIVDGAQSNW